MIAQNYLKKMFLFLFVALLTFNLVFSENVLDSNNNLNISNNVKIDYYYLPTCSHCIKVLNSGILEEVASKYNVELTKYDANQHTSNFIDLMKFYSDKNPKIQYGGVPFLIVYHDTPKNGLALQGDVAIFSSLNSTVEKVLSAKETNTVVDNGTSEKAELEKVSFIYLLITALADSVNPCIMSILALLLFQLSVTDDKKKLKKLSFIYIAIVFISYFVLGLLLYKGVDVISKTITYNNVGLYINVFVFLLLTFGAIINIKDAFLYGQGVSFSLPSFVKPKVEELAKRLSLIAVVTLAFIVTIVEFPCSGLMYLGLISLFHNAKLNLFTVIIYLIVYNVIFVLPLILMVLSVIYFKESVSRVDAFRIKYRKLFRLIMGIAMLLLAFYLLKTFIMPYLNITV